MIDWKPNLLDCANALLHPHHVRAAEHRMSTPSLIHPRYPLRRAALRAVLIQPSRHISATRPLNTRLSISQPSKPTIYRAFHQSRISRAAEDETKVVTEELANEAIEQAEVASTAAETAQVAEEVVDGAESANQAAEATELADEAAEEAIGAAEVADAAAEEANASRAGRYEAGELAAAAAESVSDELTRCAEQS